jgi:hypothetical protein
MSRSALKVSEPARYKRWGLTVDRRDLPREFVVYAYLEDGRSRHAEPCKEIARLPYTDLPDAAVSALADQAEMPEGIARQLLNQLAAKLASPRSRAHSIQH